MDREKGAQSASCPTCGAEQELVAQPDGSLAATACSNCYGTSAPAQTPAQSQPLVQAPSLVATGDGSGNSLPPVDNDGDGDEHADA